MTDGHRRSRRSWTVAPLLLLIAAALGIGAASASAVTNYYVSPSGSDAAAGTLAAPFRTLGRAQTAVRALTARMSSDIVVNLRAGTYALPSTLALSDASGDSGENGHRVVWQAYGYGTRTQEAPVLSGGRAIAGWTLVDATNHIWRTDVGNFSTRQLYKDGVRLEQGSIAAIPGRVTRTRTGYTTTSTAPQSWADPSNIDFVYTTVGYSQGICGVSRITGNATSSTITMKQPCWDWLTTVYTYSGDPRAPLDLDPAAPLRNSKSFLSAAGQWAIDRATSGHHYIYYRSGTTERPSSSTFTAPETQTLVSGTGTFANPLHDVSFKGIAFAYGTWLGPDADKGLVHIIGDYVYDGGSPSGSLEEPTTEVIFIPGNLTFLNAQDLLFEGDRFNHMGGNGVSIRGSRGNVFRGNVFGDLAGGGVKLDGLDDASDAGNLLEDNYVHDVGNDYQGSIGLYLEDIVDTMLQHNQINDVPYSGIAQTISEASGHGVQILDNKIFDTVNVMMDGGGIYTSGAQGTSYRTGATISGNDVHETINPAFELLDPTREVGAPNGIYTDVGGDYITLSSNVIYNGHQSWGGVDPQRMTFTNSYWDDDQLVWYGDPSRLVIRSNTLLRTRSPLTECQGIVGCNAILTNAGLEPAWQYLLRTP